MAVKIRLKRMGKIRSPHYRVVVADARAKRDGMNIEEIGLYHPVEEPSYIKINSERAQYWLSVGAQPSEQVERLLKLTGDWQKFKGIEGAESSLKSKEPKEEFVAPDKKSVIVEGTEKKAEKPTDEQPAEQAPAEESSEAAAGEEKSE